MLSVTLQIFLVHSLSINSGMCTSTADLWNSVMCAQCQIATGRCLCVPLSPHPPHLALLVFGNHKHLKNQI